MRSVAETFIRWHVLFTDYPTLSALKKAVANGDDASPCISGLRSVCWKIFLLFGDFEPNGWQKTLSNSRSAYTALREHFLHDIEHPDEVNAGDPLADDQNSPWITLRQDEILRAEIYQDVERCMPENTYFREAGTQKLLLDVLFIFCKLNPDIGYRQGMHELLAPVLWVVEKDAIQPRSLERHRGSDGSDGLLRDILDAQYIEHDAFTLFSLMMQTARTFYELGDKDQGVNTSQSGVITKESPIIERSKRIHYDYLAKVDPELAARLTAMEILPQIFLIRWIRLLFGREFGFDQLLRLWDALFAEDPALDLVDMICVAMLLRVRWQLVHADYSSALAILLRYPISSRKSHGVSFVQDALYLKDNLTVEGGAHIILKHSGKSPASRRKSEKQSTLQKPPTGASSERSRGSSKTRPRVESPARFIRRQGIDILLHDAAKVVYQQGEKWGVNKAVREAMDEMKRNVQGLQSGNSSPRRSMENARWSLDEGRHVSESSVTAPKSLETLEHRDRELAKMLEGVLKEMDGLMSDRNKSHEAEDRLTTVLEHAMARIGSVKECLEDPRLPIPNTEQAGRNSSDEVEDQAATPTLPGNKRSSDSNPSSKMVDSTLGLETSMKDITPTDQGERGSSAATDVPRISPPTSIVSPSSPSSQGSRPSLAESSFAWMLGESDLRSSFIASFPTPATERRQSRLGKTGFLFGNSTGERLPSPEDRRRGDSLDLKTWRRVDEGMNE